MTTISLGLLQGPAQFSLSPGPRTDVRLIAESLSYPPSSIYLALSITGESRGPGVDICHQGTLAFLGTQSAAFPWGSSQNHNSEGLPEQIFWELLHAAAPAGDF